MSKPRLVVLISGRGSNLQALIEAVEFGELPAEIVAVISNRPDAGGLALARRADIDTLTVDHRTFAGREAFDAALQAGIDRARPDLVVLAGFMRILSAAFVEHYRGRLLNIHPSLLPRYRGLHTHARALAAGERVHGVSVHFVTAELDGGPVIAQARVPVHADDDAERLAERVLVQEHRLYPRVIRWVCEGRVRLVGDRVQFDGELLDEPLLLDTMETAP